MFEQKIVKILLESPLKTVTTAIKKRFPHGATSIPDIEILKKIFVCSLNNKNPGVTFFIMEHFSLDANMPLDKNNIRPLHVAGGCGNLEAIKALIDNGADEEAKAKAGITEVTFWDILYAKGYLEIYSEVKNLIRNKEIEPVLMIPPAKDKGHINPDAYIIHRRKKQAEEAIPLLSPSPNRVTPGKK